MAFVIKIFWIRHLAGFPTNTNKNISQKNKSLFFNTIYSLQIKEDVMNMFAIFCQLIYRV